VSTFTACHRRSIRYTRAAMKSIVLIAAAGLFLMSCERHEWEETKVLHEKHGHGAGHGEKHGDDGHAEVAH
jgi:hypothetical protein